MGTGSTHSRQQTINIGIAEGSRIEFVLGDGVVRIATVAGDKVAIDGEERDEWVFTPGRIMPGASSVMPGPTGHPTGAPNGEKTTPLGAKTAQNAPNGSFSAPLGAVESGSSGTESEPYFTLKGVEIGKGFHWQRRQDQSFRGSLRLIAREGRVIAINVVGIEDYLQCVIASEMSPTAGFEFLKAHAVISRSWLLAQLDKRDEVREGYSSVECDTPEELIRWQDREDHEWFDFCADDHCQRYQGIPMAEIAGQAGNDDTTSVMPGATPVMPGSTGHLPTVDPAMIRKTARVIEATWGQVLWYDGRVCDARFSKCCGGALEEFKYCWENKEVPYLRYARDYETVTPGGERRPDGLLVAAHEAVAAGGSPEGECKPERFPVAGDVRSEAHSDLREEQAARRWILSSPRAFCNTRSKRLLGQVLKDYDSETKDFYRWTVEYTAEELRQIILERTGDDYGQILDLIPLERGVSGRICRLKIVGSKKTKIIGKELEIRKTLSRSHLYSSAFVVEKVYSPEQSFFEAAEGRTPEKFVLYGAGWGHGVGLCQIGAAAMGARGYDYRTILQHYYPSAEIRSIYPLSREQRDSDDVVLASGKKQKTAKYLSRGQRGTSDGVLAPHNKDK